MKKLFFWIILAAIIGGTCHAQNVIDPELQSILDQKTNDNGMF